MGIYFPPKNAKNYKHQLTMNAKTSFTLLMFICLLATGVTGYLLGGINPDTIQS